MTAPAPGGERGRVTVGLTPTGSEALVRVMATGWFEAEMDAYKVAIALSLRVNINTDQPLVGATTKFNIGSLDSDGRLVDLIRVLRPNDATDPVVIAERLAESGLIVLAARLVDNEEKLSTVLGLEDSEGRRVSGDR